MLTYIILDLVFLLISFVIIKITRVRVDLKKILLVLGVMLVLTVIFDNLMIYLKLFYYNPNKISGLKIGLAPIEDLAYTIAAVLLIAYLWEKNNDR